MSSEVYDRFVENAPFTVMSHMLAYSLIGDELGEVFEENRETQYDHVASFVAIAKTVADVVLNFSDNFNQSYKKHQQELKISRQSFYAKTRGIEPAVSEAIVAHSAQQAIEIQDSLGFEAWEVLPGYRCFSIDSNVLPKSDKRLKVLRETNAAPSPGKIIPRYDLQRQLFDRAYVLLNGHAAESSCCDRIAEDLSPEDVLIADRHYCIVSFFEKIDLASAFFVVRQHGRLKGVLLRCRSCCGRGGLGLMRSIRARPKPRSCKLSLDRRAVKSMSDARAGLRSIRLPRQAAVQQSPNDTRLALSARFISAKNHDIHPHQVSAASQPRITRINTNTSIPIRENSCDSWLHSQSHTAANTA